MGFIKRYIHHLGKMAGKEIEDTVSKFLPKDRNAVYLDCGCDDGSKTIERAAIIGTKKIFGIEGNTSRAKIAQENGIATFVTDLNGIWPIKTSSIDCLSATEVVEHLVNLDNFFLESKRVLKPEGKIIISTENLAAYHNIFALLIGNQPYTGPYLSRIHPIGHKPFGHYYGLPISMDPHVNVMTAKALRQLLRAYSFTIKHSSPVGFYPMPSPFSKVLANIDSVHASYTVVEAINRK